MQKIELILHPIRIRIITLLSNQALNPTQIGARLKDVPVTTLYRHLNTLAQAGILEITGEERIRGTVEKTYRLVQGQGMIAAADVAQLNHEAQLQYFMIFLLALLQDFSHAIEQRENDLLQDILYSKLTLFLTAEERNQLVTHVYALIAPYRENANEATRQRYTFTLIGIPDDNE